jgi:DNA repair exonuclease SbcCD ATPase subunit
VTPGATRDDSDYEELKEKFGDLESELEDAKSKLESQAEEITDLKDTIEQADSAVKESCKKIDDFLDNESVTLDNNIYPDCFVPKIYEQGPDGKPVHAYDLPAEKSFSDAYTAIAASIEARKNEGRPLNNPSGRVAEAYSAQSFANNLGADNT